MTKDNVATKRRTRLIGVPIEVLAQPRNGEALTDRWWVAQDGLAIFWQGAGSRGWTPQCNGDRRVAESLIDKSSYYPDAHAEHIPVAFLGRWDENWGYMLTPDLLAVATPVGIDSSLEVSP